MENDHVKVVQASYGRCLTNGNMFETFYANLLNNNPVIKQRFEHTDFNEQHKLLRHGINLVIMHAEGNQAGTSGLDRIRRSHARSKLNISPHLYIYWKHALLNAIRDHDKGHTPDIQKAWAEVLEQSIGYIKGGY